MREAAERIRPHIFRTPMVSGEALGLGPLLLKAENLQRTGSFKPRGAFNAVLQLTADERARGVITLSAGNHGQALALAARSLGIQCLVVAPQTAPQTKLAAMRRFGAEIIQTPSVRLQEAVEREQQARGMRLVHPFADERVIAGQGTVGLEILEAVPDLALVVVPVGGAGLISGLALAIKSVKPEVRVVGVEPVGAAVVSESLRAGRPVVLERIETVADGLAAPYATALNLAMVRRFVDEVVCLDDADILDGLRRVVLDARLVVEPAGAASVAAIACGRVKVAGSGSTVAVLTGGNLDASRLAGWLQTKKSPDPTGQGT
ncbi:MAG: threonine/serine dehydratase [Chloroflexi bacterium]|nr:MAG: threonine/serine dehydratase [Chloroflexota bacterium]